MAAPPARVCADYNSLIKLLLISDGDEYNWVAEPLRAIVMEALLEYARHLAHDMIECDKRLKVVEVSRRQVEVRKGSRNLDMLLKLEAVESKLHDLKKSTATLGKEAAATMVSVEAQQQRLTLQRLISMVEYERSYHQRALQILDQLENEMMSERQRIEAAPSPTRSPNVDSVVPPPSYGEANDVSTSPAQNGSTDCMSYFLGEVSNNEWAEGECKGKIESGLILTGASLWIQGILVKSQESKQKVELKAEKVVLILVGRGGSFSVGGPGKGMF